MKVVLYELINGEWLCYKPDSALPEITTPPSHITPFFSISILLGDILHISHEWESLDYFTDPVMQSIMKHVTYFTFYHNDIAYVPYNGINASHAVPDSSPLDLLHERYLLSLDFKFTNFSEFSAHAHPDYLLFHCMDHEPWSGVSECLYGGFFIKSTEKWNHYCVNKGQFPSPEVLASAKGILITPSEHSANDFAKTWIAELSRVIKEAYTHGVRIVAICFGHQLVARSLGGKVGENPSGGRVVKFEQLKGRSEEGLVIMEDHSDCVLELPEGAECLYTSTSCAVEVFNIGERVLGIQGHGEFTPYLVRNMKGEFDEHIKQEDILEECDSIKVIEGLNRFLRDGTTF